MWMGSIRMDMAVGIIIGGAFTSIVSSLVEDIINPFLGIFGGMNFDKLHGNIVGDVTLNYGKFILVKALNTAASKLAVKEDAPEEKKPAKICPMCKSEIAIDACRCPHCTSILDAKAVEAFEKNL